MNLLNEFKEGLTISTAALRANKMRSALTTLGIVIGIVTVTLMGTAIEGLNRAFTQSISALSSDVLYLQKRAWFNSSRAEWERSERRPEITYQQFKAVERQLTLARAVAPVASTRRSVKRKNQSASGVMVLGTTDQFLLTGAGTVAQGRFLSQSESEGGRPVCVIGLDVATNLFGREIPLGKRVEVGGRNFEVIGVLEKQGSFLGAFSLDNQIIIPVLQFSAFLQQFAEFQIQVKALSVDQFEETKEELRGVMRKVRHVRPGDEDDFAINQQDMFLTTFSRVAGIIATVGLFITGLSLFVGGIGIMNIMFVSVAERTREIGIRKAIGAKRRTILVQFLTEAATICLLGGLIGLAIAYPLTLVLAKVLPASMSLTVVAIALAVSLFTGVASGFFPAWRAARMNPVDALRNE